MANSFFINEALKLSLDEILIRLKTLYEDGAMTEVERGIYRQIESNGIDSLTKNQRWHFVNRMSPQCVERCSIKECPNPTYPGKKYCGMHSIEYGDD